MSTIKPQLNLRIDFETDEKLKLYASSEGKSQTQLVIDALNYYFQNKAIIEKDSFESYFGVWGIYWTSLPNSLEYQSVVIYCKNDPDFKQELTNIPKDKKLETRKMLVDLMDSICEK